MSNSLVFVSLNYSLFPNHYLSTFPAHLRKNFHRASSIAFVKPVALKVPTKQKFYWHIDILLNFIISCIPINAKSLTKSFGNKKRTRNNYDFIEKTSQIRAVLICLSDRVLLLWCVENFLLTYVRVFSVI